MRAASTPPASCDQWRDEAQRRVAPAAEPDLQEQQHRDHRGDAERDEQTHRLRLFSQHLGVVLQWQRCRLQDLVDVVRDCATVAPVRRDGDVDQARDGLPLDHGRRWRDAHVGDLTEMHVLPGGCLDQEVADAREIAPRLRRAPDHDVEHALLLEEAAHERSGEERGGGAPDVSWLQPVLVCLVEIDLDLDRRLRGLPCDTCAGDAVDPGDRRRELGGTALEDRQFLTVDPDVEVFPAVPVRFSLTFSVENASTWLPSPGYPPITFLIEESVLP